MTERNPTIAVLGGGFAGVKSALQLERRLKGTNAEILLVDGSPYHTLRPKIPQAVGGRIPCAVHVPFERILQGKRIRFVQDRVRSIEPSGPRVILENGEINADYVLIALGGEGKAPGPSFLPAWGFDQACNIRRRVEFLAKAAESGRSVNPSVAVVGGGFVGVELAAEIQHRLHRLGTTALGAKTILIEREPRILSRLPEKAVTLTRRRLEQLGVQIVTSSRALGAENDVVTLDNGETISAGTVVWAGGVQTVAPLAAFPFADDSGRIVVDGFLRTLAHPRVYAAGDCASVADGEGGGNEPSAHRAEHLAEIAARNIAADVTGRELSVFQPTPPKYLLGLGPGYGVLCAPSAPILAGPIPALMKEAVMAKHMLQLGGPTLVRKTLRPMVAAALFPKHWDGGPLHKGNLLS